MSSYYFVSCWFSRSPSLEYPSLLGVCWKHLPFRLSANRPTIIVESLWGLEKLSKLVFYSLLSPVVPRTLARYTFLLWDASFFFIPETSGRIAKKIIIWITVITNWSKKSSQTNFWQVLNDYEKLYNFSYCRHLPDAFSFRKWLIVVLFVPFCIFTFLLWKTSVSNAADWLGWKTKKGCVLHTYRDVCTHVCRSNWSSYFMAISCVGIAFWSVCTIFCTCIKNLMVHVDGLIR